MCVCVLALFVCAFVSLSRVRFRFRVFFSGWFCFSFCPHFPKSCSPPPSTSLNGNDNTGTLHNVISVGISARKLCCVHFTRCCHFFCCARIRFDTVFVSAILWQTWENLRQITTNGQNRKLREGEKIPHQNYSDWAQSDKTNIDTNTNKYSTHNNFLLFLFLSFSLSIEI